MELGTEATRTGIIDNARKSLYIDLKKDVYDVKEVIEEYKRILTSEIEREKIVGSSLYGVHRDDLEININGNSARLYASQGQQRSIVLSLKLSEGEVNKDICGEYPIFLFDDVLSELDEKRKKYVLDGIGEKQISITSCEEDKNLSSDVKKIIVNSGEYNSI